MIEKNENAMALNDDDLAQVDGGMAIIALQTGKPDPAAKAPLIQRGKADESKKQPLGGVGRKNGIDISGGPELTPGFDVC